MFEADIQSVSAELELVVKVSAALKPESIADALQNHLSPGVEARLTEEVDRLVGALAEFARRAQAISKDAAPGYNLDQAVALTFALIGFQFADAFARSPQSAGLFVGKPYYFDQLQLRLADRFRELVLDGRRYLAIAFVEESAGQGESVGERSEGR